MKVGAGRNNNKDRFGWAKAKQIATKVNIEGLKECQPFFSTLSDFVEKLDLFGYAGSEN